MDLEEKESYVPLLKDNKEVQEGTCNFVDGEVLYHGQFSVDEILKKWAGEFGWAQLIHFTLASLAWLIVALQALVMIFAEKTPQWRCLDSPQHNNSSSLGLTSSTCTPESSICSMDRELWEWVGGRSQSTISQWDLICNNEYKVGLVQSLYFVGSVAGAGLFGNLSDSFLGRKGALAIACAFSVICGFTACAPSYWIYVLLRFISGLSSGGIGTSSFVLATEPVGPSKRGAVGMCAFYFYSLGTFLLVGIASRSLSWKHLYISTSCVSVLYCLFILPFLSESPRWYLVQGRNDEALNALRSIAARNGKNIPTGVSVTVEKQSEEICNTGEKEEIVASTGFKKESGTLLDVFKVPTIRLRMLLMVYVWFSTALVYYAINLNVKNLGTNLYISVFLNGLAEVPALAISAILLGKFGRRTLLIFVQLLSGISCLVAVIVIQYESSLMQPSKVQLIKRTTLVNNVKLAVSMLGIFGMGASYNVLYIYTSELFPTVVRNAALGLANQAAQIGCVIAPLVVLLGQRYATVPFGICAVVPIVAGLTTLKLLETSNRPLYETLQGMERGEALDKQVKVHEKQVQVQVQDDHSI